MTMCDKMYQEIICILADGIMVIFPNAVLDMRRCNAMCE